jgi:hypothetical protein
MAAARNVRADRLRCPFRAGLKGAQYSWALPTVMLGWPFGPKAATQWLGGLSKTIPESVIWGTRNRPGRNRVARLRGA